LAPGTKILADPDCIFENEEGGGDMADELKDAEIGDAMARISATARHLAAFAEGTNIDELQETCRRHAIDPALVNVQRNANFSMVEDLHNQLTELIAVAKKDFYK
jgi:hypothetical protein